MVKLITWGIVKSGTSNDQIHKSILLEPLCKAFAGDIGGVEGDKRDHGTHEELREVATVTDEVKAEETQD